MPQGAELLSAMLLGLFGAGHCLGMCGGISGALAFALGPHCSTARRQLLLLCYSLGRISSYALMGALAGGILHGTTPVAVHGAMRVVAGALLVIIGIALAGQPRLLALLERGGSRLWQRIAPHAARLGPPRTVPVALLAGAAWGWLPCGLVYGALGWAATGGPAERSAALMAAFGAGTLPAVLASGALASRLKSLLQRRELRLTAALCVCAFGLWTMVVAGGHVDGGHQHH